MQHLSPGIRVSARGEDFLVTEVRPLPDGHYIVEAQGVSELVRGRRYCFDTSLDPLQAVDPAATVIVPDRSPGYARSKLFLETRLRNAVLHAEGIAVADKAAFDPQVYQYEPTIKALRLPRPRILIADGVGLGKTIEAGIFLAEMIKRGRGQRILVLTLRSILAQFQQEIWQRFAIPLVRLDSEGIARIKAQLPVNKNPFDYYDKTIVSIDTLKNNARFQHWLERSRWDVVVIDECHNVANISSQRGNLAELIASRCEALVLTSATPHNGKRKNFANLLRMIEPTSIPHSEEFSKKDIEPYYVRRFKADIRKQVAEANFPDREIVNLEVSLHDAETRFLQRQQELKFQALARERESGRPTDDLFTSGLFKAYMSSPQAAEETLRNRMKSLQASKQEDPDQMRHIEELLQLLEPIIAQGLDAKYARLLAHLRDKAWAGRKKDPRIVVFAERIRTLQALKSRLTADLDLPEKAVVIFDGSLSDVEQARTVEDFGKEDSDIRLFLTSDAGSQGVNLHHHCHLMYNYDIPWSIITLEQRNGRIDRYGQRHTPYIHYLVADSEMPGLKTDLHIVNKLKEKEQEVYTTLGDAGSVMHLYDSDREEGQVREAIRRGDTDFLVRDADTRSEEEKLDAFFASFGAEDDRTEPLTIPEPVIPRPSLFASDLAYYTALAESLAGEGRSDSPRLSVLADGLIEVLHTRELDQVFFDLPPEARPAVGKAWQLSVDRRTVQDAIQEARKRQGDWARFQMLYDLHPVLRYLMTRLEAGIDKHVALAAQTENVPPGELHFVFHGQVANQLGQQVLSEFFSVGLDREGGLAARPLALADFLQRCPVHERLYTREMESDHLALLTRLLPTAIGFGRSLYMDQLQQKTQVHMEAQVSEYRDQVVRWARESEAQVAEAFATSPDTVFLRDRRDKKLRGIRTILDERSLYYSNMAALDNQAHLQLLTVFYNLP